MGRNNKKKKNKEHVEKKFMVKIMRGGDRSVGRFFQKILFTKKKNCLIIFFLFLFFFKMIINVFFFLKEHRGKVAVIKKTGGEGKEEGFLLNDLIGRIKFPDFINIWKSQKKIIKN